MADGKRSIVSVPLGYPTTTIYIDESRARQSDGRFFAVAALKVRENGSLARAIAHVRDAHRFNGEFKFKDVTAGTLRYYFEVLEELEFSDAHLHALVVDCDSYNPFDGKRPFWQVQADLVTQLLVGAINRRELVTVLIDRISTPRDVAFEDAIRAQVNRRLRSTAVVGATSLDSRSTDLLQVADLCAGSIAYSRGLDVATYRPRESDKKKVAVRLKAALGCADFNDGRYGRVNIATLRRPNRTRRPKLELVSGKAG